MAPDSCISDKLDFKVIITTQLRASCNSRWCTSSIPGSGPPPSPCYCSRRFLHLRQNCSRTLAIRAATNLGRFRASKGRFSGRLQAVGNCHLCRSWSRSWRSLALQVAPPVLFKVGIPRNVKCWWVWPDPRKSEWLGSLSTAKDGLNTWFSSRAASSKSPHLKDPRRRPKDACSVEPSLWPLVRLAIPLIATGLGSRSPHRLSQRC